MASKLCRNRALASVLRPAKPSVAARNEAALRCFATTARSNVAVPKDAPNPRAAPRGPTGTLQAPLVNPADKYQSKADNMHKYGSWLMGCLPKYIQQFSVWKDELTIYICPSGVIPVFSFLKCKTAFKQECLASVADCS
jgi:NADH dehydrogenase (ubiquinone) Fe-S protein 3